MNLCPICGYDPKITQSRSITKEEEYLKHMDRLINIIQKGLQQIVLLGNDSHYLRMQKIMTTTKLEMAHHQAIELERKTQQTLMGKMAWERNE